MRTSKPISTISYNTPLHLAKCLNTLLEKRAISYYCYILHKPESGENKSHFHLLMIPNGIVNTDTLRDLFDELDPTCDLPLGVMPIRNASLVDWFKYSLHDLKYLQSKGLTKLYHYQVTDLISSDDNFTNELLSSFPLSSDEKLLAFISAIYEGYSFSYLLKNGYVPAGLISQYYRAFVSISDELISCTNEVLASQGDILRSVSREKELASLGFSLLAEPSPFE